MNGIDTDRLRALLAEYTESQEWRNLRTEGWDNTQAWLLLEDVRSKGTDADAEIRRETWQTLDLLVSALNRDDFYKLLINGLTREQFRTLLTDTDPTVRARLRWAGPTRGTSTRTNPFTAVALEVLADNRFDYAWQDCIEALHAPTDFRALIDALVDAPTEGLREQLQVALGLPPRTRLPEIPPGPPDSTIKCALLWDNQCGTRIAPHQCKHLPVVLALLGSTTESIRGYAKSSVHVAGLGTAYLLRAMGESEPMRRRMALEMLAQLGWDQIAAKDLVALERLIRMKQRVETPEPLRRERLNGAWYALPTTDQAAVLDALDLIDPVPATMRMGFAPWQEQDDAAINPSGCYGPHCGVFVTPALDGWTLVLCSDEILGGDRSPSTSVQSRYRLYQRMEDLSERFGTAHLFELFDEDYRENVWSQWCIARDGDITMHCVSCDDVRVYRCEEDDPVDTLEELTEWIEANAHTGEPRPEQEVRARAEAYAALLDERCGDDRLPEIEEPESPEGAEPEQDLVFGAWTVSRQLSIDLSSLGPHTTVHGTGVMAVPRARQHPRHGILPI